MPSNRFPGPCLDLLRHGRVITLATAGEEGPWSAPVYYLFQDRTFYFFSNPEARHIQEGLNRVCAGSIFQDDTDLSKLQGIQMSGVIVGPLSGKTAMAVAAAYARHTGITVEPSDILGFFAARFHARLFRFDPDQVFIMDNRRGFGFREQVPL